MPPSMHASLDPDVEQPVADVPGPDGACQRLARMLTQRRSSSAVCGYSSLSIMFLSKHSAMSRRACGSIQVVTNVARFSRALPSRISSSRTSCSAVSGSMPSGGIMFRGTEPSRSSRANIGLILISAELASSPTMLCSGINRSISLVIGIRNRLAFARRPQAISYPSYLPRVTPRRRSGRPPPAPRRPGPSAPGRAAARPRWQRLTELRAWPPPSPPSRAPAMTRPPARRRPRPARCRPRRTAAPSLPRP